MKNKPSANDTNDTRNIFLDFILTAKICTVKDNEIA